MSIVYALGGNPQNLNDVVDLLHKRETEQTTIRAVERLYNYKRAFTCEVDLGPRSYLRSGTYRIAKEVVPRRPGSLAYSDDGYEEFNAARERNLKRAEEARSFLTQGGIDTNIEKERVDAYLQEDRNVNRFASVITGGVAIGIVAFLIFSANRFYCDKTIEGQIIRTHNYGWVFDDYTIVVKSGSIEREIGNSNSLLHWKWNEEELQILASRLKKSKAKVRITYEGFGEGTALRIDEVPK